MSERKKKEDSTPKRPIIIAVDRMQSLPQREVEDLIKAIRSHGKKINRSKKAACEFLDRVGLKAPQA